MQVALFHLESLPWNIPILNRGPMPLQMSSECAGGGVGREKGLTVETLPFSVGGDGVVIPYGGLRGRGGTLSGNRRGRGEGCGGNGT